MTKHELHACACILLAERAADGECIKLDALFLRLAYSLASEEQFHRAVNCIQQRIAFT